MTNLTHNSFLCVYFNSLHVSSKPRAHHQENQLYQYNIWYMSLCVDDRFVSRSCPTCTRNGHRHGVIYTRCCIDTIDSPDDEHEVCSKHVENWNKYIEKNCASNWSFTTNRKKLVDTSWFCLKSEKVTDALDVDLQTLTFHPNFSLWYREAVFSWRYN